MKFLATLLVATSLAGTCLGKLHNTACCVRNQQLYTVGGTGFSPSMTYYKRYEILPGATACACTHYLNRNTGRKRADRCPDCEFDGTFCNSGTWHIGGDEMHWYCTKYCGATGSEAN